ncbi:hypothetical protein [Labrys neptuniae]
MRVPMFAIQVTGTRPQQYLHRARMFRSAAMGLPSYVNSEQNWPRYALLLHACELALKAYCEQSVANGKPTARAKNHDLNGWYRLAVSYGLPGDKGVADAIGVLAEIHSNHYTRYPEAQGAARIDLSNVADSVVDQLIAVISPAIGTR